jgi:hypothetical protein
MLQMLLAELLLLLLLANFYCDAAASLAPVIAGGAAVAASVGKSLALLLQLPLLHKMLLVWLQLPLQLVSHHAHCIYTACDVQSPIV